MSDHLKQDALPYTHGEAFMRMDYLCEQCGKSEILWNSRDGVTPFCINCLECDGLMNHINWSQDVRDTRFGDQLNKPEFRRMRVFVNASHPRAIELIRLHARKYVDEWWDKKPSFGGGTMAEVMRNAHGLMTKDEAVEFFFTDWSKDGNPAIISAKDYLESLV